MAKPLPNEDKLYNKIRQERLLIHPLVWQIIIHHLRNDLQVISLGAQELLSAPAWLIKTNCFLSSLLYKLFFYPGKAPTNIVYVCNTILGRVENVQELLNKLKALVDQDEAKLLK